VSKTSVSKIRVRRTRDPVTIDDILNNFDKVQYRLEKSCSGGPYFICGQLVHYLHSNKANLNKAQSDNLIKYLNMLPASTIAFFFGKIISEAEKPTKAWYATDKSIGDFFCAALFKPLS